MHFSPDSITVRMSWTKKYWKLFHSNSPSASHQDNNSFQPNHLAAVQIQNDVTSRKIMKEVGLYSYYFPLSSMSVRENQSRDHF